MWQAFIAPVANLISGYLKNKAEEKRAVHERKLQEIKQTANWDEIQAANAGSSWKDEFFTIIFSIPLILAFIPGAVPYVQAGFAVLESMPEWYKAFLGAAVAASFGMRTLAKWRK